MYLNIFNRHVLFLFFIVTFTVNSQSLVDECGGNIKCPVGTICKSEQVVKNCTDNAVCDEATGTCVCSEGYLPTSYGFCLSGFETPCSEVQCNEDSTLICSNDEEPKCTCSLEGTIWSDIQSKCVSAIGAFCSEVLECTDYAYCNFMHDWKCYCKGGFSQTENGQCRPHYGQLCSIETDDPSLSCNSDDFLVCTSDNKCACEPGRKWDGERCRALVGHLYCDLKVTADMFKASFCIQTSQCTPANLTQDSDPSQLRLGTCQCPSETVENEDGDICSTAGALLDFKPSLFLAILITSILL